MAHLLSKFTSATGRTYAPQLVRQVPMRASPTQPEAWELDEYAAQLFENSSVTTWYLLVDFGGDNDRPVSTAEREKDFEVHVFAATRDQRVNRNPLATTPETPTRETAVTALLTDIGNVLAADPILGAAQCPDMAYVVNPALYLSEAWHAVQVIITGSYRYRP